MFQVLAELRSYRRTNSTDDMDSPASLADSPLCEMRSQSLLALGLAMSPRAQRRLIASPDKHPTPATVFGSKQRPAQSSHASSSKLAAMVDQIQVPDERERPASAKGGNVRPAAASRASPSRLAAAVGKIPMLADPLEAEDQDISRTQSDGTTRSMRRPVSATLAGAVRPGGEEVPKGLQGSDEEGRSASQLALSKPKLRARAAKRKGSSLQRQGSAAMSEAANPDEEEEVQEGGEDEWAPSPASRGNRSLRVRRGVKKRNSFADVRVAAARRATAGARKRSEKLTEFSGVTLKNGR